MAYAVNKVMILGNIGVDLELKEVGETHVLNFSVATSEKYKKKGDSEYTEKTEWHRAVAWGKPAEIIAQFAGKGSKIYIEGQLQTRKWEKDGQDHYSTEINIREFVILDSRSEDPNVASEKGNKFRHSKTDENSTVDDDDSFPF
jgi:single-strand DNA-binding protein